MCHKHSNIQKNKRLDFYYERPWDRELARAIIVEVQGLAEVTGYIHNFVDFDEESVNTLYIPGDMFAVNGNKIKMAGDTPMSACTLSPWTTPQKPLRWRG
jgi:hypothetical protein